MLEKADKVMSRSVAAITIFISFALACAGLFYLPASGASGETGTLPQIITFQISPRGIVIGESAVLSWKVENAAAVNIDNNVGDVAPVGQVTVNPAASTTYKITVSNNAGVRMRYTTLQVTSATPDQTDMVPVDPVTGRNSSVDLSWEDYCYSSEYEVQIARDSAFTLKVFDSGVLQPADSVFPAFSYPPGQLEAGHTYYWRVRTVRAVTGQWIISPWSEARAFTVKSGFPVRANSYGVEALSPINNNAGSANAADATSNTNDLKPKRLSRRRIRHPGQ